MFGSPIRAIARRSRMLRPTMNQGIPQVPGAAAAPPSPISEMNNSGVMPTAPNELNSLGVQPNNNQAEVQRQMAARSALPNQGMARPGMGMADNFLNAVNQQATGGTEILNQAVQDPNRRRFGM